MDEARLFLALPRPSAARPSPPRPAPHGSSEAARRLFQAGRPLPGTLAEAYLRQRGITAPLTWPALRYHPRVYCCTAETASRESWPALLAAVTDLDGRITGIQRTWLDPVRRSKAPLADPPRALGHLLGNGVRFGVADNILAAGEGIETMLALKSVLPVLPMVAGVSANHLAALVFAPGLRRLYVARDNDAAGLKAAARLHQRGAASASRFATSCRQATISTSTSVVSVQRRCAHASSISSFRRTWCGSRAIRATRNGRPEMLRSALLRCRAAGKRPVARSAAMSSGRAQARTWRPSPWRSAGAERNRNGARQPFSAAGPQRLLRSIAQLPNPPGFAARSKMVTAHHPPLRYGPCHPATMASWGPGGCSRAPPPARHAVKAAIGAATRQRGNRHVTRRPALFGLGQRS